MTLLNSMNNVKCFKKVLLKHYDFEVRLMAIWTTFTEIGWLQGVKARSVGSGENYLPINNMWYFQMYVPLKAPPIVGSKNNGHSQF